MTRPPGYAAVLRTPGVPRLLAAAALSRLSYGCVALALLLAVQSATGSYAAAGAALGALGLPAVLAPWKARALDRWGRRRVLPRLAVGYAAVLLALAAAGGVRTPAVHVLLAGLAGLLTPPVGPVVRGVWAALTPDLAARQRAYGLDAVVEEVLFAVSPLLVAALVAAGGPASALVVTAALVLAGSLGLARAPGGQVAPGATGRRAGPHPLAGAAFRRVLLAVLAVGVALGPLELAVAARAGGGAATGWLLGALSVGSAAGGLLWGRLPHRRPPHVLLLGLLAALAAGLVLCAAAPTLPLLAAALGLAGLAVAPSFVVAYLAADALCAAPVRTEASTWVATASNLGGAAGAAAGGLLLEHGGAASALLAGAAVLLLAAPALVVTARRSPGVNALT